MPSLKTIDEYIKAAPKESQARLRQVRDLIRKAAPKAEERIGYGIPAYYSGTTMLVGFAAFKGHIGFYPTPGVIAEFKKDLAKYKGAKGSVQFPMDKALPLALIKKMAAFRVKQQAAAAKKKKTR